MAIENKRIIGIDPGTNLLGYGVIDVISNKPRYVSMGVIDLRKIDDPFAKLSRIFSEVGAILDEYKPDNMAIESPFYGKNAQVMLKLGRAQGSAITAAISRDIPVFEYAPRRAKQAITGNGAASKEQVSLMIQKTLGIELDPRHLDATDALAIAMCHYYQLHNPLFSCKGGSSWEKFVSQNPDRIK